MVVVAAWRQELTAAAKAVQLELARRIARRDQQLTLAIVFLESGLAAVIQEWRLCVLGAKIELARDGAADRSRTREVLVQQRRRVGEHFGTYLDVLHMHQVLKSWRFIAVARRKHSRAAHAAGDLYCYVAGARSFAAWRAVVATERRDAEIARLADSSARWTGLAQHRRSHHYSTVAFHVSKLEAADLDTLAKVCLLHWRHWNLAFHAQYYLAWRRAPAASWTPLWLYGGVPTCQALWKKPSSYGV